MKRIERYFKNAETCQTKTRTVGIETESLFINRLNSQPISLEISQEIMEKLTVRFGYEIKEEKNNFITKVEKNGFAVFYELGWNNFELITPPLLVDDTDVLFLDHDKALYELYLAGKSLGAKILNASWDNNLSNTLIIPDKRDEIWLKLDGIALQSLGHIACIHFNIDLTSIEEGMRWIRKLNEYYRQSQWPPKENYSIWQQYITTSLAKYENDRYGQPPDNFADYCRKLSEYKVVMNRLNGELCITQPVMPFAKTKNVDINLFLRSVWWWSRLRVRNGKLILEIRDIPRSIGAAKAFLLIKKLLSF